MVVSILIIRFTWSISHTHRTTYTRIIANTFIHPKCCIIARWYSNNNAKNGQNCWLHQFISMVATGKTIHTSSFNSFCHSACKHAWDMNRHGRSYQTVLVLITISLLWYTVWALMCVWSWTAVCQQDAARRLSSFRLQYVQQWHRANKESHAKMDSHCVESS